MGLFVCLLAFASESLNRLSYNLRTVYKGYRNKHRKKENIFTGTHTQKKKKKYHSSTCASEAAGKGRYSINAYHNCN